MKTQLILFIFTFVFYGCSNPEVSTGSKDSMATENHIEQHSGLSLNNGAKWQTDESTRSHFQKASSILDKFKQNENPDTSDYKSVAQEMQNELDGLIKDCRMTGPDHDALHKWLEPVLKSVNHLKKVQSRDEGRQVLEILNEEVGKFKQYFT